MQTTAGPMLTLTKQLAVNTGLLPNAVYDRHNREINVTVIVSRTESGGLIFRLPPITIKGPAQHETSAVWTVLWNYLPDSSLAGQPDGEFEIQTPTLENLPAGVTVTQISPNLQQIKVDAVPQVVLTSFSYDIASQSGNELDDPTIVVAPEPVGG